MGILRNSSMLIVTKIVTKLASTVLIIGIARILGDVRFGVFSTLLAYVSFFSLVAEFGLTVPLIRTIARQPENAGREIGKIVSLKIPLSIIAICGLICTSFLNGVPWDLAFIFGLSMVMEMQAQGSVRAFEGVRDMKYIAIVTILEKSVLCVGGFSVLLLGGNLFHLGIIYLLSNATSFLFSAFLFSRKFSKIEFSKLTQIDIKYLKTALPFVIGGFFSILYNREDILILNLYRGPAEIGWYNAALRIIEALIFIPTAMVGAVFPLLAKYSGVNHAKFTEITWRSLGGLLGVGLVLTAGTFLFSDQIIYLLYKAAYIPAGPVLKTLCLLVPFYFGNALLGNALIAAGHERLVTSTLAVGSVINGFVCFYLIPTKGIFGASIGRVSAEGVAFMIQLVLVSIVIHRSRQDQGIQTGFDQGELADGLRQNHGEINESEEWRSRIE